MTTTAEPNAARTAAEPPPPLVIRLSVCSWVLTEQSDPRVLAAMGANPVGHLDPYFVELMDQTMSALRGVYRTQNHHTMPISATGSAGLETIMMNLLEDGDSAVVAITGYFGQRLAEMARRAGADVRTVEVGPGEIVDPAKIAATLEERPAKLVAFVHVETTTGVASQSRRWLTSRGATARSWRWIVSPLGGCRSILMPSASTPRLVQPNASVRRGLAPITIGRARWTRCGRESRSRTRGTSISHCSFSIGARKRRAHAAFHHTAPIAAIYGFHEALRLILEEGPRRAGLGSRRRMRRWFGVSTESVFRFSRRRQTGARRST
jgi:alanine-glyoxylate transaminase/serine-glyoxylate transaminase/serine-pyruvate transaminase